MVRDKWTDREFTLMLELLKSHSYAIDITRVNLSSLRTFLENPILLEHGLFTETLRAVFHLNEELVMRPSLKEVPQKDLEQLRSDVIRTYNTVAREWVDYMMYLKYYYPYLFSLTMRRIPFDREASVILQ